MEKKEKIRYTKEGYEKDKSELDWRIKVERERIKEAIGVAKGFGDLSENAEYTEARREQSENETRILELQERLDNAEIIVGTTVKVQNVDTGAEMTYFIVGTNEVDPFHGIISDLSPIGAALVNREAGDKVEVEIPNGIVKFIVLDVQRK